MLRLVLLVVATAALVAWAWTRYLSYSGRDLPLQVLLSSPTDSADTIDTLAAELPPLALDGAELVPSNADAPVRDSAAIAYALAVRGADTYLPELLKARDGWNYRWPDRRREPMRVWVQEAPGEPGWARLVRESFAQWEGFGLPLVFTYTLDSAMAEVHVTWVDRFEARMTGRTQWAHDQHGWLRRASIELALHMPDGRANTADGVRAIARHEVGHLIGLDHTTDPTSVMAAEIYVTNVSEADRRTARLVYDLPPGKLR